MNYMNYMKIPRKENYEIKPISNILELMRGSRSGLTLVNKMSISRTGVEVKPNPNVIQSNLSETETETKKNELDIDENLLNIYKTILLKGSSGEVSLGSILSKSTNVHYFLDMESYLDSGIKDLSTNNIVVMSKNCDTFDLSLIPQNVYVDVNNSLKEMMEIEKNTEFTI